MSVSHVAECPDLGPEYLEIATMVAVRGISAHLRVIDAAEGTVVDFEVPSVAHWSITRDADGWRMSPASDATPAVRFTIPVEHASTLWSRGYLASEIRGAITAEGDPDLAGRILDFMEFAIGRDKV